MILCSHGYCHFHWQVNTHIHYSISLYVTAGGNFSAQRLLCFTAGGCWHKGAADELITCEFIWRKSALKGQFGSVKVCRMRCLFIDTPPVYRSRLETTHKLMNVVLWTGQQQNVFKPPKKLIYIQSIFSVLSPACFSKLASCWHLVYATHWLWINICTTPLQKESLPLIPRRVCHCDRKWV